MDRERLNRLREALNQEHSWPSVFMFKFILPNDEDKITALKQVFGESASFTTKLSGKGNYISITVHEMMLDADSIFFRYTIAARIEGIISL